MKFLSTIRKFCTPAYVYLVVSSILVLLSFLLTKCMSMDCFIMFAIRMIFVILWAFVLNYICDKVSKTVSWILVILPAVLLVFHVYSSPHMISISSMESSESEETDETKKV